MIGSPAATDAIERARRTPALRVGLHVVVARGLPVLPAEKLGAIVDADGSLPHDLVRTGFRIFFSAAARRQLEQEIRAQFEAFRLTGIPLDHVDAHCHMHIHPTVFAMVLRIGHEFGMKAVRIPYEPLLPSWRASGATPGNFFIRLAWTVFLFPWLSILRRRARRAGLIVNDAVFGMNDSGRMTTDRLLAVIEQLPDGVSEVYFHPAVTAWDEGDPATVEYERRAELEALTSDRVKQLLQTRGITCVAFADLDVPREEKS